MYNFFGPEPKGLLTVHSHRYPDIILRRQKRSKVPSISLLFSLLAMSTTNNPAIENLRPYTAGDLL
ncbi:hypothetical protein H0H93_008967 [Arthromyces matolae]|nr:hypothetical protein H0H93_008967 [Arthromyces matolae]